MPDTVATEYLSNYTGKMTVLYTITGICLETWCYANFLKNFPFMYSSLAQAITISQTRLLQLHLLSTEGVQNKPP